MRTVAKFIKLSIAILIIYSMIPCILCECVWLCVDVCNSVRFLWFILVYFHLYFGDIVSFYFVLFLLSILVYIHF